VVYTGNKTPAGKKSLIHALLPKRSLFGVCPKNHFAGPGQDQLIQNNLQASYNIPP
jgi:hypothetical protein